MNTKTFKRIARLLKVVYAEIEKEAIAEGISLNSPEYDQLIAAARQRVLENEGFTLQQYRDAKSKVAGFSQADMLDTAEQTSNQVEEVAGRHIPTTEEIQSIAESVAQKYIVPPIITNQIVKEIKIKEPKIVKETVKIKETYNDKALKDELKSINKKVDSIKVPPEPDLEALKENILTEVDASMKHNIDLLGMPNFRKLGMGLQQQIDTKIEGVDTHTLTVSDTAPSNPKLNDLWYDIS